VDYVFQFGVVWKDSDLLLRGAWLTLKLSFLTLAIGLVVGTIGALFRNSHHRLLRAIARSYVEAIRNTPFLIQLLLLYLGLPVIGIRLAPEQAALVALVVNFGAYATEIIRAGIEAIPKGQVEAGRSLGLTPLQIFFLVVMKPALRIVYPALSSQFVLLVLTSSVVSVISAEELTAVADRIASRNFRTFEVYFIVTLMYLAFSLFFEFASTALQKRLFRWPERT
jgi:polar amino acid transport system permease protein